MTGEMFATILFSALVWGPMLLFRLGTGRWPAWFYGLAFAWWFPVRRESSLTIAAGLLDADEECSEWKRRSVLSFDRDHTHSPTGIVLRFNCDGGLNGVRVNGRNAKADSWGFYCLDRSWRRWSKRSLAKIERSVERAAAEAVLNAYGGGTSGTILKSTR